MGRRIVLIQGHPDPAGGHLCHALAEAYGEGARAGGHELRSLAVASLGLPYLSSKADWETATLPAGIREAQQAIAWAEHLVIFYPLWLGSMPAVLKGFFEQVLRPGFALAPTSGGSGWGQLLKGKSARIVVTMGMPAFVYRWFFRAHSLKSLERNILRFCGIRPVRETLLGMVESPDPRRRQRWLEDLRALGRTAR